MSSLVMHLNDNFIAIPPPPPTGNRSFRPRIVSALSRFGPELFRPGSFRPGSIRPWVVSAQFGGSFRLYFFSTIRLVTEGQLKTFWLVGECMGRDKELELCTGWFTQTKAPVPTK